MHEHCNADKAWLTGRGEASGATQHSERELSAANHVRHSEQAE